SMFYDPMIAKLCSWSKDRDNAIRTMAEALDQFEVEGIGHNLPFCAAVMKHPRFISGNITTAFIEEEYPDGFEGVALDDDERKSMASIAAIMKWQDEERKSRAADANRFKASSQKGTSRQYAVGIDKDNFEVSVDRKEDGKSGIFTVKIEDKTIDVHCDYDKGKSQFVATSNAFSSGTGASYYIQCAPLTTGYRLRNQGTDLKVTVLRPRTAELLAMMPEKVAPDTSNLLLCPMPGLIVKLEVAAGDAVEEGQSLAIVEAMKMENVLKAEKAGIVKEIPVKVGDSLAVDEVIMEFEK
ncbi:MAG: biotin/lipoyl-containing protein, partial [Pseudomonadota bacterium]